MNTRSKSTTISNTNAKPYKTHAIVTKKQDKKMADKTPALDPTPAIPNNAASMENMTINQKLNMLILSVAKLKTVPNDILSLQNSVKSIQHDVKDIPMIKGKIDILETSLKTQQQDIETAKNTTTAIEESLTTTQKDDFIGGDYNINYIKKISPGMKKLSKFCKINQFKQIINTITRPDSNTCIDLILTNSETIKESGALDINISDHLPIFFIRKKVKTIKKKITFKGRSYKNCT